MELLVVIMNKINNLFSIVIYFLLGDSYLAYKNPEKLFKELDKRASQVESNIGIAYLGPPLSFIPQIVYIKNSQRRLFAMVSDYGQSKNHYDETARAPLKIVEQLIGSETLTTMQGLKAVHEKKIFKHYLNNVNELHQISLATVNEYIRAETVVSFPILINQIVNIILSKAVFGINQTISEQQTREVREIGSLMTKLHLSATDIKKGHERLQKVSTVLLTARIENPINRNKYVAKFSGVTDLNTPNQDIMLSTLAEKNIAGSLLASTNLADMIMQTLNAIEIKQSIKDKLLQELEKDHSDLQSLKQLPYLNLIYLEAQRLFSPSIIARKTSKKFTFFTENKKEYSIPAHSFLIAPIRARHLDPTFWSDPQAFSPERFLIDKEKKIKHLMAFSDGQRACPAKYGLSEVIFKTFISTFAKKVLNFKLDIPVEEISEHALNTSWSQNYNTTFNMR